MADKTQSVTVKRDGADVHYSVDAKDAAEAKKIIEQVETRQADRASGDTAAE